MKETDFNDPYTDALVGIPTEHADKEAEARDIMAYRIRHFGPEKIEGYEMDKTARDIEILEFAENGARSILKKYGRAKDLEIPSHNMHILKPGATSEYTEDRVRGGGVMPRTQSFMIDRDPSDVTFCLHVFHEMLHLKSFKSAQVTIENQEGRRMIESYRSGFSMLSRDGQTSYFNDFEEALIGVLTEEFFDTSLVNNPLFAEELKIGVQKDKWSYLSRKNEIDNLNKIIDELWAKNQSDYKDRNEIKDLFIDAQVNGHLLAVGKLIEKTFGKGSFRQMGSKSIWVSKIEEDKKE